MDPNSIRDLIKSTTKPLLIRNLLNWEILQWDLHRWKEILGTQPLQFRQGIYTHTDWPQFENSTKTVQLSFDEFLTFVQETPNKWLYFDYKYLKDWFRNVNELRKHISWDKFGFPERGVEDSTFWLGSKGAHTPMHIDTYGCNIVAQIYGRKRWLLFPSGENLQRTRIPYEESSIYSKINMFSPRGDEFDNLSP
uniref:JmjC domain-containing protein n=1 Tax=Photinus pyralis TaxID=7054 RepID=A0A1Y1KZD8_PHOPY